MQKIKSLRPTGARVVIEPEEALDVTDGGIVLPDQAKERPSQGLVLAVGPGRRDERGQRLEPDLKVGDRVLFSRYGGTEIKVGGKLRLVVDETDVLVVLE